MLFTGPGRLPFVWGATAAEVADTYGCDALLPDAPDRLVRAVGSRATPARLYRWLCQLRLAPYSYDLVDNYGRRSPRALVPGTEDLAVGQTVATIFTLAAFTPDEELTLRIKGGRPYLVFGDLAVSYAVRPADGGSRLVAVLRCTDPPGPAGALRRRLLSWGDVPMMRKQLLTLAALAERSG
ncbi:MAG: hypothetical protein J2P24_14505 [Streptosporangiales bacterium]|nr:hypothetical protein [Streptosporangiales bacterium]